MFLRAKCIYECLHERKQIPNKHPKDVSQFSIKIRTNQLKVCKIIKIRADQKINKQYAVLI